MTQIIEQLDELKDCKTCKEELSEKWNGMIEACVSEAYRRSLAEKALRLAINHYLSHGVKKLLYVSEDDLNEAVEHWLNEAKKLK